MIAFNGGTLSFKLRECDAAVLAPPAAATGSGSKETTLSDVLLFFARLIFLKEEDPRPPPVGSPSVALPVAIPIVTSLPALITGGAAEASSSSLRPGMGLCATRVARAQREGAARSGRREGCVPWRRPKERDISCSRMDWSRRRMCLSIFGKWKKKKRQATMFVRVASMGLGEGEKKNKQLSTYRVVGRLREADFLLRTAHDLLDQPA